MPNMVAIVAGQSNANALNGANGGTSLQQYLQAATGASSFVTASVHANGAPLTWGRQDADWFRPNELAADLIAQARAFLDADSSAYLGSILWVQGEADALSIARASEYTARLNALFDHIESALATYGARAANFSVSILALSAHCPDATLRPHWDAIRAQQLAFDRPGVVVIDPDDVRGVNPLRLFGQDGLHYAQGSNDAILDAMTRHVAVNIAGTHGDNTLTGREGDDRIQGLNGRDVVRGNGGNDALQGGAGADLLLGGQGHDRLSGDGGWDRLYGETGDDFLFGGGGNDQIFGGTGNDRLAGGAGDDILNGGAGADRAVFLGGTSASIDLAVTRPQLTGFGRDTLISIEDLMTGGGNDLLYGNAAGNMIESGSGNDVVWGRGGNDRLFGGAGQDRLLGGPGQDSLNGGAGADTLVGGPGSDTFIFTGRAEFGDRIMDFSGSAGDGDLIAIARGIGGGLRPGVLSAAEFYINTTNVAQDAGDRFILRTVDRSLWFDADGTGSAQPVLIARFDRGVPTADDIVVL